MRVQGTQVDLTIAGQTLTADFSIEQGLNAAGEQVVKIAVDNVSLSLGDVRDVTDGEGQILVSPRGVAGSFTVSDVDVHAAGRHVERDDGQARGQHDPGRGHARRSRSARRRRR